MPAARTLRLLAAVAALSAAAFSASAELDFVFQKHKVDARATAELAGVLRKLPVQRTARNLAAAEKRKPKGRIVAPPGKAKKRAARPAAQPAPAAAPTLNDPLWSSSWSLAKVNAPAAWQLTTGAADTVVAVLDTGVDLGHPDLQGAFVPGYDFVNRDEDPSDDHGHGTMVAGVIAARANNRIGGAGACSRCSLMPVKVIAGNGSGNAADVAAGISWAAEHGADVINLSFVLSGPDDGVAQAIDFARNRGAIVVAAAGNAGNPDATYPAAYPNVVSVTATDASDDRYGWASFGGWVRLAAPGCSQTTTPAGGYGDFCGTSSAAAFVSGLVGLARSFSSGAAAESVEHALAANGSRAGEISAAGRVDAAAILGALRPVVVEPEPVPAAETAVADFS